MAAVSEFWYRVTSPDERRLTKESASRGVKSAQRNQRGGQIREILTRRSRAVTRWAWCPCRGSLSAALRVRGGVDGSDRVQIIA